MRPLLDIFRRHPVGFWFIFWAELAERASFYGMRVLLAMYLAEVFHFTESRSAATVQIFMAVCYLLPLAGGWLADRYLGRYRTIVYFSVPYILGHVILGSLTTPFFLYTALLLLAMGSGAIKPNTSTLMGLMYEKAGKDAYLTEAFSYFYLAINVGAAVSSLSLPLVRNAYGYATALMFPTVLMAAALAIFIVGRRFYPEEKPGRARPVLTVAESGREKAVMRRLAAVFGLLAVFWLVYDQNASTWVFFARSDMKLVIWPFGLPLTPDQLQGLNPVLIIMLTPVFNWMWRRREARRGAEIPATHKMMVGFILVTACMFWMSMAGYLSETGQVSVWFIVLATIIMAMAELCVSVVGLHFAFTEATPRMKSTVMAAFLLSQFLGDGLGAGIDRLYGTWSHGDYFGLQALIIAANSAAFYFVARSYQKWKKRTESAE
ncbi:MAG: oligopeptide:H+ symporter [Proteobacteria bacterium]|nr:oligopeptide:H+ symporter [Pseudomonadota bacterium]